MDRGFHTNTDMITILQMVQLVDQWQEENRKHITKKEELK